MIGVLKGGPCAPPLVVSRTWSQAAFRGKHSLVALPPIGAPRRAWRTWDGRNPRLVIRDRFLPGLRMGGIYLEEPLPTRTGRIVGSGEKLALDFEAPAHQRQASALVRTSRTASGFDCGWMHPGCPALGRNPTAIAREEVAKAIGCRTARLSEC